jgi:hypothetical protein
MKRISRSMFGCAEEVGRRRQDLLAGPYPQLLRSGQRTHPDGLKVNRGFRSDCRLSGHYSIFEVTSGLVVILPLPKNASSLRLADRK